MTLWEDREPHPQLMAQVALHDLVTAYEGPANIKDEVSIAE
jgi:hypothetical protein